MVVPYNAIPIETHMAMITAEQANVPVLADAAKMWTEVRTWIESARVDLHTRVNNLMPHWKDEAGRELEEKFQRTDAELKMWGERIDGAQVVETLTTLATSIPEAFQTVSGLYQSYLAAISNPFTAPAAVAFQQAAGTRMTALGAQFDMSMLKVCAAAGIKSPSDVLPEGPKFEPGSTKDVLEAATATVGALESLESLASAALTPSGGSGGSGVPKLPDFPTPSLTGPSLAGVDLTPVSTAALPSGVPSGGGGGLPALSGAPMAMGLPTGPATPTSPGAAMARPTGKRPMPDSRALTAKPAGGIMPMMPPHGMHPQNGTVRPSTQDHQQTRSRTTRRPANGTDGVPTELRGRATDPTPAFTYHQPQQPSDDELWEPTTR